MLHIEHHQYDGTINTIDSNGIDVYILVFF